MIRSLQKGVEKLGNGKQFMEACARELAARLLSLVIRRTPVGEEVMYTDKKGETRIAYTGGTLRRGWTAKTETEAEIWAGNSPGEKEIEEFVKGLMIEKVGGAYQITVINPVKYAGYVEYGHRTRERKDGTRGWVNGQYMLTISEHQLSDIAPSLLENKLRTFLSEVFRDGN